MANKDSNGDAPITIKKYANRRLYNTATSSYVTLDDLCQMVKDDKEFVVFDAKSGEDITRSVLTQIIVEEESKGQNLLPISFLRQLISFYGDSLQGLVPRYLDHSMESFARNQEQMRTYMQNAFDGLFPFGSLEEMSKQNAAFMEQAMRMFTPFSEEQAGETNQPNGATEAATKPAPKAKPAEKAKPEEMAPSREGDSLDDLKRKIDDLQKQIETISDKKPG